MQNKVIELHKIRTSYTRQIYASLRKSLKNTFLKRRERFEGGA